MVLYEAMPGSLRGWCGNKAMKDWRDYLYRQQKNRNKVTCMRNLGVTYICSKFPI